MEYTINLPDTLEVTSREQTVTLDLRKLDPMLLTQAVTHGLTQKIADAAAGAAQSAARGELGEERFKQKANVKEWTGDEGNWAIIAQEGKRMMELVVERLLEGDWGAVRTGGGGVPAVVVLARQMAGAVIRRGLVARDGNAKVFAGLTTQGKRDLCDKFIGAHPDILGDAQAELDARKEAAKTIDLGDLGL